MTPASKIILTGYRATGKTAVGKQLAAALSFDFIDMDKAIEEREQISISDMVAQKGWSYFRDRERTLLEELICRSDRLVIGTGGGAILHQEIWSKVMMAGMVVWLTASKEVICQRLAGDEKTSSQRPSLTGNGTKHEVAAVLAQREPLYRAGCHIAIDTSNKTITEISDIILQESKEQTWQEAHSVQFFE